MPTRLQGLPGLNRLSAEERERFLLSNDEKLKKYKHRPDVYNRAAEMLYNNQAFKGRYGDNALQEAKNRGMSYEDRNELLRQDIINQAWQQYSPFEEDASGNLIRNNRKGFGRDWEKYSQMSLDAKQQLLESDWLTPSQIEQERKDRLNYYKSQGRGFMQTLVNIGDFLIGDAFESYKKGMNAKILDRIYNDDSEKQTTPLFGMVSQAHLNPEITGHTDDETIQKFIKKITPDYASGNMGIPEYAAYFGDGNPSNRSGEMEDFSVDDMREVLAKAAVYEQYLSPEMASTVLNNEAKRYIKDHQSWWKRKGLFANDLLISTLSYSADKVNGIYNLALMAQDKFDGDKPIVWVDDRGEVFHPSEKRLVKGRNGAMGYYDDNGEFHSAHQARMDRTTLHAMGKNLDGSKLSGWKEWIDPVYWTRAEQFGTMDEEEQKQYEQLGASPYKVMYDPNEDTDIWYEAFKMASFGLADGLSMLIPYGIGAAGRVVEGLSAAGKAGKAVGAMGKLMDKTGKYLSNPVLQGTIGAGGIAYAYGRNAFQETLAQNMANAEEALLDKSRRDIYNQYQNDPSYKRTVDAMIASAASSIKSNVQEGIDDETIASIAKEQVFQELAGKMANDRKSTPEYAQLVQQGVDSAGAAASNIFIPEAIKYSLVNTLGFRKFLYTHPTSLVNRAKRNFKGIEEVAIGEGKNAKKRLTVPTKFGTTFDKMKQFGKIVGSQVWGGAWTNGTDDMMVDAAEKINEDSYDRYLRAFETGEPMADVYGFADGVYSYWRGLQGSLGQDTTWNAALVGGLGSVVSATPHFANIVSYFTKEGRQAFKDRFGARVQRDENGIIQKDPNGKPIMEEMGRWDDFGSKLGFFIQNGVLNTYYGAKQEEQTLQQHADFVNNLLDQYQDFEILENLVAASKGLFDSNAKGETKTMQYIRAIETIAALQMMGNKADDPTTLSSKIQEAKTFIDRAADIGNEKAKNPFTEEELNELVSQYYANNNLRESPENKQMALLDIAKNAKMLKDVWQSYEDSEKELQELEDSRRETIPYNVRHKMHLNKTLTRHWEDRLDTMKSEIGDNSSAEDEISGEDLIASLGGAKGAKTILKIYDRQSAEINTERERQKNRKARLQEKYDKDKKIFEEKLKEENDATDEASLFQESMDLGQLETALEDAKQQEEYLDSLLAVTTNKSQRIKSALEEKNESAAKDKILSTDEIFSLDPMSRARMLREDNRSLYSKRQLSQIDKLKQELLDKDPDALQKVQDIATLTRRIATNKEAYAKMAEHPKAAAWQLDFQRTKAATNAYRTLNRRNAQVVADYVEKATRSLKGRVGITEDQLNDFVFKFLRTVNTEFLDTIDEEGLLPAYQREIHSAKSWGKTLQDIVSLVRFSNQSPEQKRQTLNDLSDIIAPARNQEEVMKELEKALKSAKESNNTKAVQDYEKLLSGLEKLGHLRDSTVTESKKEQEEREKKQKERDEAAKQELAKDEGKSETKETKETAEIKETTNESKETPITGAPSVSPTASSEETTSSLVVNADVVNQVTLDDYLKLHPAFAEEVTAETRPLIEEKMPELRNQLTQEVEATIDYLDGKTSAADYLESLGYNVDTISHEQAKSLADKEAAKYKPYIRNGKKTSPTTAPEPKKEDNAENKVSVEGKEENKPKEGKESNVEKSSSTENKGEEGIVSREEGHKEEVKEKAVDETKEKEGSQQGTGRDEERLSTVTMDGEEYTVVSSETMDSQYEQAKEENMKTSTLDALPDMDKTSEDAESKIDGATVFLGGNALPEFILERLKKFKKLIRKRGDKLYDNMNNFYDWLEMTGTHLQNIIDDELSQILSLEDAPDVQFMVARTDRPILPRPDGKPPVRIDTHLMLVMEYTKAVEAIHKRYNNGGVFKSGDKSYLLIGVAGYGSIKKAENSEKKKSYDLLMGEDGLITRGKEDFFRKNREEMFYVPQHLHTRIVPASLTPGYIIKQQENESTSSLRKLSELMEDRDNKGWNTHRLSWQNLPMMIQALGKVITNLDSLEVEPMYLHNEVDNLGNTFVLAPAGNGKHIALEVRARRLRDVSKDSSLYKKIKSELEIIGNPESSYQLRVDATRRLGEYLYFNKNGDFILISPSHNIISLVRRGENKSFVPPFFLDRSDYSFDKFMKAMEEMNPRINYTFNTISNPETLREYDDAGVLMLDVAKLGTVGSRYLIYPLGVDGKIIGEEQGSNYQGNGEKKVESTQVIYKDLFYEEREGKFYLRNSDVPINEDENPELIEALGYNLKVIKLKMMPIKREKMWDYYAMQTGEHPEVVKIKDKSYEVIKLSEEDSRKFLEALREEEEKKRREAEALERLKQLAEEEKRRNKQNKEVLGISEVSLMINPDTGETVVIDNETKEVITTLPEEYEGIDPADVEVFIDPETGETIITDIASGETLANIPPPTAEVPQETQNNTEESSKEKQPVIGTSLPKKNVVSFIELVRMEKYEDMILDAIEEKWPDAPIDNDKEVEEYLRRKGVPLDGLEATDEAVEALIKTITNCRQ